MTTSSDPEEIRREIERTRANLSGDVDALADQANPKNIARRQVDTVKDSIRDKGNDLKDRIMGVASDASDSVHGATDSVRGAAGNVRDAAGNAAGSAQGAVSDVPGTIRRKSQGNPLGAGLVAFGAGMLIAALIPASEKESQVAQRAVDAAKEHGQPMMDEAKSVGQQMGQELKDSATDSAQQVKETAQDSVDNVKQQGQSSAQKVKDQATPNG